MNVKTFLKNTNGCDYIVGDIHGHFGELKKILSDIGFDSSVDRLFATGDLIDRGPDNLEVLWFLKQHWFHSVRGNHEDMIAEGWGLNDPHMQNMCKANGGLWFDYLGDELQQRIVSEFNQLPYAIEIVDETGNPDVGILHGDLPSNLKDWLEVTTLLSMNNHEMKQFVTWGRSLAMKMRKYLTSNQTEVNSIVGINRIYFGHNVFEKPTSFGQFNFVDTGSGFPGGYLSVKRI